MSDLEINGDKAGRGWRGSEEEGEKTKERTDERKKGCKKENKRGKIDKASTAYHLELTLTFKHA